MSRRVRLTLATGALALAAMLLVAGLAVGRTRTTAPEVRTDHVTIHFSRFLPAQLGAAPGETIRFVIENTDPIDHEFILGDRAIQLFHERGTDALHDAAGQVSVPAGTTVTTTYTFGDPGRLTFGCHLPGHFAYGMRGTVTVS
jgi:uncharacterized cupredoxin-like copper-binding protein